MLQDIRDKSQGWIAKAIIGVIVILFALTGFDAIFRVVGHDEEVASVNGEGIAKSGFTKIFEQQRYILRTNGQFDDTPEATKELKHLVLTNLVNYQILLQAANKAGLGYLPEAYIKQYIEANPLYQTNGHFDYNLFVQDIRNQGYANEADFVKDKLESQLLGQLQSGIVSTSIVTDDSLKRLIDLLEQTRDFSYKEIEAAKITNITDEEIKQWFETHKETLKTPERIVLQYVELKRDSFLDKITVSEQEIKDFYTKRVIDLDKSAVRQRIAHILVPVTADQTEEQAKAKIDAIAKQLKEGKDFAVLAKEYSQDQGSANNGGDLGFVTSEDLPDPAAFIPVLKSLHSVGEVSEPTRSRYGWHLIKLTDRQKTAIPSFESLHNQLADELKQQKAYDMYLAEQRKLDSAAFENFDNLEQVAKDFGLTLQTTKPFANNAGYDKVTTNSKVIKLAFSKTLLDTKENSNIIDISPNSSVIIRVKEHLEPTNMSLQEATADIKKALQKDKAEIAGAKLIAELKAGKITIDNSWKTLTQIKQPLNLDEDVISKLGIDKAILTKVFATAKPQAGKSSISGLVLDNGNYVVISLTKVNDFKGSLSTADKAKYQQLISVTNGNKWWDEYQNYLKNKAEIKYFETEETK